MKAIINGKRYDTEKAILIGESGSGGNTSHSDFRWWHAGLYRTPRSGAYFLAGTGGGMTRFSPRHRSAGQNAWSGGEAIIPITREQALEWAEAELRPEAIDEHFSDLIEDA